MADCCEIQTNIKKRILWIVLWINLIVFGAQFTAAIVAHSSALLADSFDMIGDAFAYALSIFAIARGSRWLARAALFKGIIIIVFASLVLIDAIIKIFAFKLIPSSLLMIIFGIVGLIANSVCLYLLTSHRDDDINMRSVWIRARNDILGNIAVLITAFLVFLFVSRWPDIIVGITLAIILLHSGYTIIRSAKHELQNKK